jgi:hypothetical protein
MHLVQPERHSPAAGWWLYFALMLGLTALSLLSSISSPLDLATSIVSAFGLAGLWGYIRQVAVGWRLLWAAYFALSLALNVAMLTLTLVELGPSSELFAVWLLVSLLVFPLYLALWRYAYRSPAAWLATDA